MAKGNNGEGHPSSNGADSAVHEDAVKSTRVARGQMTRVAREEAKKRFLDLKPELQEVVMRDWEKHDETKQELADAQAEIRLLKEQIEDQKVELEERADQIAELIPFKENKSGAIEREVQIRLAEALEEAIAEHDKKKSSTYKRRTTSIKDREEKATLAEEAAKAAEERADAKLNEIMNLGELRAKAERLDKLEAELTSTQRELAEAKKKLSVNEIELMGYTQTKENLTDLQKTHDQLTADHNVLNRSKQGLEAEVDRLKQELNNSMASVNEETARELTNLREQVQKLTAELEVTVREKGDKHLELNKAKDEIQRLSSFEAEAKALDEKLAELRDEIEALNESISNKETARVESGAKVSQLTIDLKDCKRKYRLLNASYKSLQDNMKARAEDIDNLREQLGS